MDITDALAPKSDQLDAVELVNPRTFTIDTGSRLGTREGATVAEIRLVDFPRVWRPSKGMLDVLAHCWGTDGKAWAGRSVTLYNDPEVTFGKDKVGGIRISHLSHIDGPLTVAIRGRGQGARKIAWPVQPLAGAPADPTADEIANATREQISAWWASHPHLRPSLTERAEQIKAEDAQNSNEPSQGDLLGGEQ